MLGITVDAICLGPTGNSQGTYKFMNIATGLRIYRRKWTEVPAPDWVIKRVNDMGKKNKMDRKLIFKDRIQNTIEDEIDDSFDDAIIDDEIIDDDTSIDEGVNYAHNDEPEIEMVRETITLGAALRVAQAIQEKELGTAETGVPFTTEMSPVMTTPRTYASVTRQTPTMERRDPGSVRIQSPTPRVKLATPTRLEAPIIEQPERRYSPSIGNSVATNLEIDNPEDFVSDDDDQSSIRDAGELEIEDIDEFHPDTITPAQVEVLQPRSPIRTRSHARTTVDDNVLIHYALTQMTMR